MILLTSANHRAITKVSEKNQAVRFWNDEVSAGMNGGLERITEYARGPSPGASRRPLPPGGRGPEEHLDQRIACVRVENFPIAAIVRSNPALDGKLIAISRNSAPHSELNAVSPQAGAAGIRSEMTIAQARAIDPKLIVMTGSVAAERSAGEALLDAAESISPVLEAGESGQVWIDLAGLERIYDSEEALATELRCRIRRVGMEAAVGIASNREIAALAARCGSVRIIPAGMEREFLDWLPLDMTGLSDSPHESGDLALRLERWGLRRLGDLARLDPSEVGSRLGRRGIELCRIARGGNFKPLVPRLRAESFVEEVELEYGIENLQALGFVMNAMLARLIERLALRGLVAGDMSVSLGLEGNRLNHRRVAVAAASREVRAMLTLLTLSLENSPPEAAVETVRIEIEARTPRPLQADMFLPPCPVPDRLETTIARLAALCGPDNVGALKPSDSYRPEAVRIEPFAPRNGSLPAETETKNISRLVIRAIRPAIEVEVMCMRGIPEFVRGPTLGGRVVSLAGPWRREGEWWRRHAIPTRQPEAGGAPDKRASGSSPYSLARSFAGEGGRLGENGVATGRSRRSVKNLARDYYEMALDDGGVYRVFHDLNSEAWFLDGVYD